MRSAVNREVEGSSPSPGAEQDYLTRAGGSRLVAFRATSSTRPAAADAPSWESDHIAISPARPVNRSSLSSRLVAKRIARGESSRLGTDRPAPDQATRAAFSPMSPTDGQTSNGVPTDSDFATVPCPP